VTLGKEATKGSGGKMEEVSKNEKRQTNLVRQRGESTVRQIQQGDLSGKLSVTWKTFAANGQTHSKLRNQPGFRDAQFLSELGADLLGILLI